MRQSSSDFYFIIFFDSSKENGLQVAKLVKGDDADGSCRC